MRERGCAAPVTEIEAEHVLGMNDSARGDGGAQVVQPHASRVREVASLIPRLPFCFAITFAPNLGPSHETGDACPCGLRLAGPEIVSNAACVDVAHFVRGMR